MPAIGMELPVEVSKGQGVVSLLPRVCQSTESTGDL